MHVKHQNFQALESSSRQILQSLPQREASTPEREFKVRANIEVSSRFEPTLRCKRECLGGGFPEIMEVLDPARLSLDSVVDLGVGVIEAQ